VPVELHTDSCSDIFQAKPG